MKMMPVSEVITQDLCSGVIEKQVFTGTAWDK